MFVLNEKKCDFFKAVEEDALIHFVAIIQRKHKFEKKHLFRKPTTETEIEVEKKILLTVPKSEYLYSYDPDGVEPMGE